MSDEVGEDVIFELEDAFDFDDLSAGASEYPEDQGGKGGQRFSKSYGDFRQNKLLVPFREPAVYE